MFGSVRAFTLSNERAAFTADKLMKDIKILSSDDMMGRAPATEGDTKAIEYITKQYQDAGLKPINGAYTQDVNLIEYKKDAEKSITLVNIAFQSFL